jgi:Phosphotransferase enzyme family
MRLETIKDRLAGLLDALEFERRRGLLRNLRRPSSDPLAVEGAAKRYITYRLRPDLKLENPRQSVEEPGLEDNAGNSCRPRIEMPLAGVRSLIRFVHYPDRSVTLRVYPPTERLEAARHVDASRMLEQHGLTAPRILAVVDEPRRYGVIFIVEEFLNLHTMAPHELTPAHLDNLGSQLASLHSISRPRWGALKQSRRESYFSPLVRRINRYLSELRKENVAPDVDEYARVRAWFLNYEQAFRELKTFSLTHGKLHAGNGLFTVAGEFCFLDFTTLEWAVPVKDVVLVRRSICGGLPDHIRHFEDAYLPRLSEADRAAHDRFLPFFEALYLLTSVAMRSKRLKAREHLPREGRIAERRRCWDELVAFVSR